MKIKTLSFALLISLANTTWADNGLITVQSQHNFEQTVTKLTDVLNKKGMKIFATIAHSQGAKGVGVDLAPTTLVIFGNPKVGAPLMACQRSVGIDLPQKALITENDGKVSLSYNDPGYLAKRHNISGCDKVLDKVSKALAAFAKAATQ